MALTKVNASNIIDGVLPVANGGTGASTQAGAANAVLPSQTGNSGKYLTTNGTDASWGTIASSQWTTSGSDIYYNTGNVGIGTASPARNLSLTSSGNTTLQVTNSTSGTASSDGCIVQQNGLNTFVLNQEAGALYLGTSNTERLTIDSSGNVGINTTSPSSFGRKLLVNGTGGFNNDSGTVGVGFSRGVAATYGYIGTGDWAVNGLSTADFGISSGASGALVFGTGAGTERGRFTSAGLFQFNSGYGSVQTAYGCRAWVNFNGTGTISIRASGNVSSITDNGTGDYTVTFSSSMPDTSYATTASARHSAGALSTFISVQTVGLGSVRIQNYNAGGSLYDDDTISVVIQR